MEGFGQDHSQPSNLQALHSQKEQELRDVTSMRIGILENALRTKHMEIADASQRFEKLKVDYRYNESLIAERDEELDKLESENQTLEERLKKKENDLYMLQVKNTELENNQYQIQRAAEMDRISFENTKSEMRKYMDEVKLAVRDKDQNYRDECENLRKNIEKQIEEKNEEIRRQKTEITLAFDELLRTERANNSQKLAQLQQQIGELNGTLRVREQELEGNKMRIEQEKQYQKDLRKQTSEAERLAMDSKMQLDSQRRISKETVDRLQSDLQRLMQEKDALSINKQKELTAQEERLKDAWQSIASIEKALVDQKDQFQALVQRMKEKNEIENENLKSQHTLALKRSEDQREALSKKVNFLQTHLETEKRDLSNRLHQKEHEIDELRHHTADSDARIKVIKEELESQLSKERQRSSILEGEATKLRSQMSSFTSDEQRLRSELKETHLKLEEARADLATRSREWKDRSVQEKQEAISTHESLLNQYREKEQRQLQQLNDVQRKCAELDNQVVHLQEQLSTRDRELQLLHQNHHHQQQQQHPNDTMIPRIIDSTLPKSPQRTTQINLNTPKSPDNWGFGQPTPKEMGWDPSEDLHCSRLEDSPTFKKLTQQKSFFNEKSPTTSPVRNEALGFEDVPMIDEEGSQFGRSEGIINNNSNSEQQMRVLQNQLGQLHVENENLKKELQIQQEKQHHQQQNQPQTKSEDSTEMKFNKSRIKQLENQIEEYKSEIKKLQGQLVRARQPKRGTLGIQLQQEVQRREALADQLTALTKEREDLKRQLDIVMSASESLKTSHEVEIKKYKNLLKKKDDTIKHLSTELEESLQQKSDFMTRFETERKSIDSVKNKHKIELRNREERYKTEMNRLKESMSEKEKRFVNELNTLKKICGIPDFDDYGNPIMDISAIDQSFDNIGTEQNHHQQQHLSENSYMLSSSKKSFDEKIQQMKERAAQRSSPQSNRRQPQSHNYLDSPNTIRLPQTSVPVSHSRCDDNENREIYHENSYFDDGDEISERIPIHATSTNNYEGESPRQPINTKARTQHPQQEDEVELYIGRRPNNEPVTTGERRKAARNRLREFNIESSAGVRSVDQYNPHEKSARNRLSKVQKQKETQPPLVPDQSAKNPRYSFGKETRAQLLKRRRQSRQQTPQ